MLNATEIRIGNLFKDKLTGAILYVCDVKKDYGEIGQGTIGYHVIDRSLFPLPDGWQAVPLPITGHIIPQCPLDFISLFQIKKSSVSEYTYVSMCGDDYSTRTIRNVDLILSIEIPHYRPVVIGNVHHLQNIYQTFTGEELEINL